MGLNPFHCGDKSYYLHLYEDFTNEADVEDDNKQLLKKHSRPFEHVTDVSSILAVININMIIYTMSTITLTRRMPSNQKADLSTINSDSSLQFPHSGLKEFVRISWKNVQRPKNLGSRVALLSGKFLRVRKVFAHITDETF